MNKIICLFFLVTILTSCSKDELEFGLFSNLKCAQSELIIISNNETCDGESSFFICESLEAQEIGFLDSESFEWIPEACQEVGKSVEYKHGSLSTDFKIVNKDHYILDEKILLGCNENFEHGTYICQKNEIFYLEFLNEKFGEDTIHMELKCIINSYHNQDPGMKEDMLKLYQLRSNSNIANFSFRYDLKEEDFDRHSRTFHDVINLRGNSYENVVEFKVAVNVLTEPHLRLYIQKNSGILGFEIDNIIWVKSD